MVNSWQGGFEGRVTVTNAGASTINGWRVTFTLASGQTVAQSWNGSFSQQGNQVTLANAGYNGQLAAGASTTVGYLSASTGSNEPPGNLTCAPA